MPDFAFEIKDVFDLGDRYEGVTLIGPPSETSGGLAVGDHLLVPTKGGEDTRCECVGFPSVNLGPERAGWVRVSVTGVIQDQVLIDGRASRVS